MARLSRRLWQVKSLKTAGKEAKFEENLSRFVRARAHVRALMTRKSCAVGMRNTILRNYLKK